MDDSKARKPINKHHDQLTDRGVKAQKPQAKAYLVPDGRGLYLKVQPGGSKSWLLRYQRAKKVHDMGLGSYPEVPLAEARQKALWERRALIDGIDPLAARRRGDEAAPDRGGQDDHLPRLRREIHCRA
jgi:hypothetical protein